MNIFRKSQRGLEVRGEQSGLILLGPHQFSACSWVLGLGSGSGLELQAPTPGQALVPCLTSDVCSDVST